MNLEAITTINWDKDYDKFIEYLKTQGNLEYQEFTKRFLNCDIDIIGIKIPELHKIAKEIIKGDYVSFIKNNKHHYYEEVMLHGLIIGYLPNYNEVMVLFDVFLKYVNNWSVCDTVCANLKIVRKNLDKTYPLILSFLYDEDPWVKRVGIVLLLSHYINDDYIDDIIIECSKIKLDDYYVKMALAWLISVCYIKYPIKTIDFLRFNRIDNWTHNKAIQKIRESLRVSKEEKEKLNYLKREIIE